MCCSSLHINHHNMLHAKVSRNSSKTPKATGRVTICCYTQKALTFTISRFLYCYSLKIINYIIKSTYNWSLLIFTLLVWLLPLVLHTTPIHWFAELHQNHKNIQTDIFWLFHGNSSGALAAWEPPIFLLDPVVRKNSPTPYWAYIPIALPLRIVIGPLICGALALVLDKSRGGIGILT